MKNGSEFLRRHSRLGMLTSALLVSMAAMSGLALYLVEKQLVIVTGHAVTLVLLATATIPLAAMILWSARRLRHEWALTGERERWLDTTLRSIGDGVVSTDADGRVTFLNSAAEKLTGCSEDAARGRPLEEILQFIRKTPGGPSNPAATAMRDDRAEISSGSVPMRALDGAERAITYDATPVHDVAGGVTGCVIVLRDVTERELADQALRASQEMFGMITNHTSDMIAILDAEGRRLYNSASYERLLAPPSELYTTDSFSEVHPEDRERIKAVFAETIRTGKGQRTEYRLIDRRGEIVHIESVGSLIHGRDGGPPRVLVVSRDSTERYLVEQRLRAERNFSDTLINSMPGIFYLYDQRRIILRWNKNMEAVSKYTAGEIAKLDPLDFFRDDQKQLVHQRMLKCFAEGSADVEVAIVAKDGTERPFYVTGLCVEIDGQPCMLGVGIDVSERLTAESTVRATMRRLGRQNRALSEQARVPPRHETDPGAAIRRITEVAAQTLEVGRSSVWFYDSSGSVLRCEDLFEVDKDRHTAGTELVERNYPIYFAALADERAIAANHAATDLRTREFAAEYLQAHGITSMLDAPIRAGGRMVGVLCNEHTGPARTWTPDEQNFAGSMADLVTLSLEVIQRQHAETALRDALDNLEIKVAERTRDLELANERLQELDRLKSEFLATMSHELRTPLNSIIGFTGILRQGLAGPLNPEQLKQLGMVYFSARHLLGLINDLLDLSRIESGKMEVIAEDFPLLDVATEVVQSLTPTALQKKLTLEVECDDAAGPQLHTDRKKVFQILLNLVNNALKFTEKGGVQIALKNGGSTVDLIITDTGIGIRPESIEGLFQAFRQVDGSARRVYEGTGLGLYLCKKLSNMLGGNIRAESDFGAGSRFTVTLPKAIASTYSPP